MLLEENRNCNCNNMQENTQYVSAEMNNQCQCNTEPQSGVDCNLRKELIDKIRCYEFAINELALYLDTHPDESKALCLHRKYCKEAKELKDKYQKVFGPLTINYPCNKWRWLEEPWPWERGNF